MNQETRNAIEQVLARVVSTPIPVRWRSHQIMPGGGERRSFSRGSNGHDIQARVEYEPGDDPREIDWAATAQTGGQNMFVTQYIEPRHLTVCVLASVGKTMDFGTQRTTKRVLAAELVGSVVKSAGKTHDQVKLTVYGKHDVIASQRTMSAQKALFPAIATMVEATDTDTAGGGDRHGNSGLTKALASLPRHRSLVFVISDFLSISFEEKRALKRAGVIHDVVCLAVNDLRENELPTGWGLYTFTDLGSLERRSLWLTRKTRERFARERSEQREQLLSLLKEAHCDIDFFQTNEEDSALERVMRVFGAHRR